MLLNEQIQKLKVSTKKQVFFYSVITILPMKPLLTLNRDKQTHMAHVMLLLNVTVNAFEILM